MVIGFYKIFLGKNFFGFGNETINNDDDEPLELDYNRVRIRTLKFAPSLIWRGFFGSKARLGISYENIEIEETEDRFINEFYLENGEESHLSFFGIDGEYSFSNTDNEAFPTLGMAFVIEGGFKTNLDESSRYSDKRSKYLYKYYDISMTNACERWCNFIVSAAQGNH